jgi:hypothetical protein
MPRNPNKIDYSKNFPIGFEIFEEIQDPRHSGHTLHHFGEIVFMAFVCIVFVVKNNVYSISSASARVNGK